MTKNISVTNELIERLLFTSSNASKLIEESLIFYVYAMQNGVLDIKEVNRILSQKLIKLDSL